MVVLSSSDDPDALDAVGLGVADSLAKPVDFEQFLEAASAFSLYWRSRRQQKARSTSV